MNEDRAMYRWRKMTSEERRNALADRQLYNRPWRGPYHFESHRHQYLMTAACYEHQPIIGTSCSRMADFESELLKVVDFHCARIHAWVILPNHYHLLVDCERVKELIHALGQLHGQTSHRWNGEENCRGRKVWHRCTETTMKSDGHFWATMNYVFHNPVRHGYVERWQDWPYSNALDYLAETGHDEAVRRWKTYPISHYGQDWDPPEC